MTFITLVKIVLFTTTNSNLISDGFEVANYVMNKSGNPSLMDREGHTYWRHFQHETKTYWICSKKKQLHCPVRLTTEGDFIVKCLGEHIHLPKYMS